MAAGADRPVWLDAPPTVAPFFSWNGIPFSAGTERRRPAAQALGRLRHLRRPIPNDPMTLPPSTEPPSEHEHTVRRAAVKQHRCTAESSTSVQPQGVTLNAGASHERQTPGCGEHSTLYAATLPSSPGTSPGAPVVPRNPAATPPGNPAKTHTKTPPKLPRTAPPPGTPPGSPAKTRMKTPLKWPRAGAPTGNTPARPRCTPRYTHGHAAGLPRVSSPIA